MGSISSPACRGPASTLLAALLRQNPRFHAAMTSPVASMYTALESAMSRRNETAVFIDDRQRRNLLSGVFSNYYTDLEETKLVFDTNRFWCAKLPALTQLFPDARVICCVRNIAWIMDSIERLVRRNAFELSGLFGFEPGNTVYTRVNRIAMSDGLVGYALDALKEGFFGEQASRLILVEYQALARDPEGAMRALYGMLDQPYFAHDFDTRRLCRRRLRPRPRRSRLAHDPSQGRMDRATDRPATGSVSAIRGRHVLARCAGQCARRPDHPDWWLKLPAAM